MKIRTRTQWGARYAAGAGPAPLPYRALYLHHSVTLGRGDTAMRRLERIGQDRFGAGISYTYGADDTGQAYEGTGVARIGTHTRGANTTAAAIVAIGNYDLHRPSADLLEGLAQLAAHGHRSGWWPARFTGGHRDAPGASTACPGRHLQAAIPNINRRITHLLQGADDMTPEQERKLDRVLEILDGRPDIVGGKKRPNGKATGTLLARVRDGVARLEGG